MVFRIYVFEIMLINVLIVMLVFILEFGYIFIEVDVNKEWGCC